MAVARQLGEECVEWAVSAVYRCFLYDTLGFMTKERFEAVHTPLVNLIQDAYVCLRSLCIALALARPSRSPLPFHTRAWRRVQRR
jgi:hypothetical protein